MILLRLLDRHVLWEFVKVLAVALLALASITILVHLMDHVDVFLDQKAAWSDVGRFYLYEVPYNLILTLPMAMLVATILTIGDLGRHGELTAMKSSGISLYRIGLPLVAFGLVTSAAVMVLGQTLVPRLNGEADDIYQQDILKRESDYENFRGNFVYQNSDGYTYIVRSLFVEDDGSSADQVEVQRQLADGTFLRIDAPQMVWDDSLNVWVLRNGEIRVFPGRDEAPADTLHPFDERMYTFHLLRSPHLDDHPKELLAREKDTEEMGYTELQSYISERERLGAETRKERVDLQMKISYPFANLIIVIFGIAMVGSASHAGRQSATAGFGFALFLTIVFWGLLRVSQGIGYGGGLAPPVAAWLPNGAFLLFGIVLLLRART